MVRFRSTSLYFGETNDTKAFKLGLKNSILHVSFSISIISVLHWVFVIHVFTHLFQRTIPILKLNEQPKSNILFFARPRRSSHQLPEQCGRINEFSICRVGIYANHLHSTGNPSGGLASCLLHRETILSFSASHQKENSSSCCGEHVVVDLISVVCMSSLV